VKLGKRASRAADDFVAATLGIEVDGPGRVGCVILGVLADVIVGVLADVMVGVLSDVDSREVVEVTLFVVGMVVVAGEDAGPVPLLPPSTETKFEQNR